MISSPFNPASPEAYATRGLFEFVLWLGAAVFVVVAGLVVVAAIRFRARPGGPEAPQDEGKPKWEFVWTGAAALLLLVILVPTLRVMRAVDPDAGSRQPDLIVIGHQWWWEIRYPQDGVVAANEVHIPTGRPLLVRVDSADVIHTFWVPQLAPKIQTIPGPPERDLAPGRRARRVPRDLRAVLRPRARLDADPGRRPDRPTPSRRGRRRSGSRPRRPRRRTRSPACSCIASLTCDSCHGTGVAVGPDLTHFATRQTLAAGRIANTPETLARWLADPERAEARGADAELSPHAGPGPGSWSRIWRRADERPVAARVTSRRRRARRTTTRDGTRGSPRSTISRSASCT